MKRPVHSIKTLEPGDIIFRKSKDSRVPSVLKDPVLVVSNRSMMGITREFVILTNGSLKTIEIFLIDSQDLVRA